MQASHCSQPIPSPLTGFNDADDGAQCDHLDHCSTPTMKQLTSLSTRRGSIRIIKELAPIWNEVGRNLDFDKCGTKLRSIEKSRKEPEECCVEVFYHWLLGNGIQCSWGNVIQILNDCDRRALANKLSSCMRNVK